MTDLSRRHLLAAGAGLALSGTGAAAQPLPQLRWNLPCAYPAQNFHTENLVAFARDVEQATSGRMTIQVHAGASLFPAPQIKRAVATGQAHIGEVLLSIHENEDPVFGLDVVPFVATSFADSRRLWAASKAHISRKLAAQGLTVLFAVPWGPQGIYANRAINTVEDMRGLRWRAYNAGTARLAELLGMQSVTIQAAELPQALATGVVNSFMSSGSTGYDSKVWESLSHFYDCQAWLPKNVTFVNTAAFNSLDPAAKEALTAAAATAENRGWARSEEIAGWYLNELRSKGMTVQPASEGLMAGLRRAGETLTADWIRRAGADGQAIIEAFRRG